MSIQNYPVPELEGTIKEMSRVLRLILSDEEFEKYNLAVKDGMKDLEDQDIVFKKSVEGKDNWATDIFKNHLLSLRYPIPVSTALPVLMRSSKHKNPLSLSAALLWSVGNIVSDKTGLFNQLQGTIMEQTQQDEIFSTSRIPGKEKDKIQVYTEIRHAVVIHKDSAFIVNILNDNGKVIPVQEIYNQIISIANFNGEFQPGICNYTALERNKWNEIRDALIKKGSQNSLNLMESAIIILALDNSELPKEIQKSLDIIKFGSKRQSCMRYYDKSLNIAVFENGRYGLLFEHTVVDGMIITILAKLLSKFTENIEVNKKDFTKTPVKIIKFEEFGREIKKPFLKSNNIVTTFEFKTYPDILNVLREQHLYFSWINFALQMTLHQTFEKSPFLLVTPTHVRHFKNGRSDPTYSVTEESNKLVRMMCTNTSDEELLLQIVKAFEEHKKLIKDTKSGKAIGPHIAIIRQSLKNKSKNLEPFLDIFKTPSVYVTGHKLLEEVEYGLGNTYSTNQLIIGFLGRKDKVDISMSASGIFVEKLASLEENFKIALLNTLKLTAKVGIAYQMSAIQTIKSPVQLEQISKKYSIVIHGGAGEKHFLNQDVMDIVKFSLKTALLIGIKVLDSGKSSVDAVEAAVMAMEDCFIFNAGKGAVYNHEGIHELEASIMDGKTKKAGAVTCLTTVKNPIKASRIVMDKLPHAFIAGNSIEIISSENNIAIVPNNYFNTDIRYKQFLLAKSELSCKIQKHPQTVGAVALDSAGNLAAASSTGGLVNKLTGRIGDTAIIGAGLYADEHVAVACTGDGDAFIRKSIATKFVASYNFLQCSLEEASKIILENDLKDSFGGFISIDFKGNIVQKSNAGVMFVASFDGKKGQIDIDENKRMLNHDYVIMENEEVIAYLSQSPCTPGVTIIEKKFNSILDIFDLEMSDFVKLMMNARNVSKILCSRLEVKRCALISEPREDQVASVKLIPLHGLSNEWKPCISNVTEFNKQYPGYCSSKNGPRESDEALNAIQLKLKQNHNYKGENYKFHGRADDNNLFARIVKGEEKPQWRIWEDEDHIAFLTPFPNTPGFTVICPRKHFSSDVFVLDEEDYMKLIEASYIVSILLRKALCTRSCAIIFEGYEIDYAHVKLIPIPLSSKQVEKSNETEFQSIYTGYISTLDGPKTETCDLEKIYHQITSINPPSSWKIPEEHSIIAIQHPWYTLVFQIQNTLYHSTVEFFHLYKQFAYAMTPLTTDTISSPMGLGSDSEPVHVDLLGQSVFLADSMQFSLEYFLRLQNGLPGTYYVSPSFRGEEPDSTHLNQFYHVECELLGDINSAIKIAEQYIYYLTKQILSKNKETIMKSVRTISHIEKVLKIYEESNCFPRIKFEDALKMLPLNECFENIDESKPEIGMKITRSGEQKLMEIFDGPVWLTEMDHIGVPFYQAYVDGSNLRKAKAADLLIGMGETIGLGERHATAEEVRNALDHHQIPEYSYKWYINMRKVKPLKTSGWGMGTERYLCWILNHYDVRDMHIIPRLKNKKFLP